MSEPAFSSPRPVGLVAILAIFVCLGLSWIVLHHFYRRHGHPAPYNVVAENEGKDDLWQATPAARLDYLHELRAKHNAQLQAYGWVDQKNGVVQIPIERAMQLVVRQYAGQSSSK